MDGRCLPSCPKHTRRVETAAEAICVRDEEAINDKDGTNDDLPVFEIDKISADTPDACHVTDCAACGLSGDFCT